MSQNIVYINGQFMPKEKAQVSVMDRGFLYGDGVYEVIPVYNGKLFLFEDHIKRLNYSLEQIRLDVDWSKQQWQQMMENLIEKNGAGNLGLYLQVTRGAAEKRLHTFPEKVTPTVFAMVWTLSEPAQVEDIPPCKVITTEDIRWKRCDIKSISLLGNVLMSQLAREANVDEAFVVNDGIVTEGASSNFFVVKDGRVMTSPGDNRILGGITRKMVIDLLARQGLEVEEKELLLQEVMDADEIWLTSSTKEIRPVIEVDGLAVGDGQPGTLWKQTASLFLEDKKALFYG
ncbi:MAG TPA: D-amino-acid transaminase [Aeromonadales bacterium]|nr:D-amino-acid transaminase [Aeromonadales bacterium]